MLIIKRLIIAVNHVYSSSSIRIMTFSTRHNKKKTKFIQQIRGTVRCKRYN